MTVPGRATRAEVEAVFRSAPEVYLYGIGDLADHFWHRAVWWATPRAAIGLLRLDGIPEPIIYAQGFPDDRGNRVVDGNAELLFKLGNQGCAI